MQHVWGTARYGYWSLLHCRATLRFVERVFEWICISFGELSVCRLYISLDGFEVCCKFASTFTVSLTINKPINILISSSQCLSFWISPVISVKCTQQHRCNNITNLPMGTMMGDSSLFDGTIYLILSLDITASALTSHMWHCTSWWGSMLWADMRH